MNNEEETIRYIFPPFPSFISCLPIQCIETLFPTILALLQPNDNLFSFSPYVIAPTLDVYISLYECLDVMNIYVDNMNVSSINTLWYVVSPPLWLCVPLGHSTSIHAFLFSLFSPYTPPSPFSMLSPSAFGAIWRLFIATSRTIAMSSIPSSYSPFLTYPFQMSSRSLLDLDIDPTGAAVPLHPPSSHQPHRPLHHPVPSSSRSSPLHPIPVGGCSPHLLEPEYAGDRQLHPR